MYWPYYFNEKLHISSWQKFTLSLWKSETPPLSGYNQQEVKSGRRQRSHDCFTPSKKRNRPVFWWHIHLLPPISAAWSSPPAAQPLFCTFPPLLPTCRRQEQKGRRFILTGGDTGVVPSNEKPEPTASQTRGSDHKKMAGCDGHLSQTRPSILILPNESPTEGTWWDHLPQDGKIHTSITSSQHITPPHCYCFTQHWHPRGHQLWITCGNAIYPIIGMKHTIISLKNSLKCHDKYCCSAGII